MKRSHVLVLILLMLLEIDVLWQRACADSASRTAAMDGAVVRAGNGMILPADGTVTLPIEAIEVQNLGAATVMISYDPTLLQAVECQRNPAFNAGMCNRAFDRDEDGEPDAVRFNVLSIEGLSGTEEDPLNLADITWAVVGESCLKIASTLEVEASTFTDPVGIPINVSAENGQVIIGTDLTGDLDCDCDVDVVDIMMVAGKWSCQLEDECYDVRCDLDGNGDIDVVDIMQVVAHWGDLCPP